MLNQYRVGARHDVVQHDEKARLRVEPAMTGGWFAASKWFAAPEWDYYAVLEAGTYSRAAVASGRDMRRVWATNSGVRGS